MKMKSLETRQASDSRLTRGSAFSDPGETKKSVQARTAASKNNVKTLKWYVKNRGNVELVDGKYGRSLLHVAARADALDAVKYLVEDAGASLHVLDAEGNTPYDDAIELGCDNVVKYLLAQNKIPFTVETAGLAARSGYLDIVKTFIEKQGQRGGMRYRKKWFLAIAEQACKGNSVEAMNYLLDYSTPALLNAQNSAGDTLLHIAARLQTINLEIIMMLLKKDEIDVAKMNKRGHTPVISACEANQASVTKILVSSQKVLSSINSTTAILAGKLQRWEVVEAYVRHGGNANVTIHSYPKLTLLHLASQHGSLETVQLLVEAGAHYDRQDKNGRTPLALMVAHEHVDCALWMVNYVNPHISDKIIIQAVMNGWCFILEEKLRTHPEAASHFKSIFHKGMSLIQIACEMKRENVATFLVKISDDDFRKTDPLLRQSAMECIFENGILNAIPHAIRKHFHVRDDQEDWENSTERTGKELLLTYMRNLPAKTRHIALERCSFLPWRVLLDFACIPTYHDVSSYLVKGSLIRDDTRILYISHKIWHWETEEPNSIKFQRRREFHYSTIVKFAEGYDGPDFDYIWLGTCCLTPDLKEDEPLLHEIQLHNILTAVCLSTVMLSIPDIFMGQNAAGRTYSGSGVRRFTESAWVELENVCAVLTGISQYIALCSEEDLHFALLGCTANHFEEACRSGMRAFYRSSEDMLVAHTFLGSRYRDPVQTLSAVTKFFSECEKTILMKVLLENQFTVFEMDSIQMQSLKRYFKGRTFLEEDIIIIMSSLMGILGFCLDLDVDRLENKLKKEKPLAGRVWLRHNSSRKLLKNDVTPIKIKKKGLRSFFKNKCMSEWAANDLDNVVVLESAERKSENAAKPF